MSPHFFIYGGFMFQYDVTRMDTLEKLLYEILHELKKLNENKTDKVENKTDKPMINNIKKKG